MTGDVDDGAYRDAKPSRTSAFPVTAQGLALLSRHAPRLLITSTVMLPGTLMRACSTLLNLGLRVALELQLAMRLGVRESVDRLVHVILSVTVNIGRSGHRLQRAVADRTTIRAASLYD
jgi:hypothetical protein